MVEQPVIRVLIADDFKILRDVIHLFLQKPGGFDVVGEAPDLDDALEGARSLQPDVILMNDYLPPINSAHASALFRKEGLAAPILIISLGLEPEMLKLSLANGANGIIGKDEIDSHLAEAVRRLHQGETYLSPRAAQALQETEGKDS